jgi:replicative DNA helicase
MSERVPPHNTEAEQSVLGAMLLDKEAISKCVESLTLDSFYHDVHQYIYKAIINLYEKNTPIDLVTLTSFLRKNNQLDSVGGSVYLTDILDSVPTAANVEHYIKIVEEAYMLRSLITAGSNIVSLSFEQDEDVNSILEKAEKTIFDIAKNKTKQPFIDLKKILLPVMTQIEEAYGKEEVITGVPSGFGDLDYITSGFQRADLIIMAARPSMGKTSLALNIAANVAIRSNIPTAIFSIEMSKEQLAYRLLCSESGIDSHRLKSAGLKDHEWKSLTRSLGKLSEAPIFIDDTPAINTLEMKAKSRRLSLEQNVGLIIVDYLQLIHSSSKVENRTQEISSISRALKALAREINVPIIALSQLSRAVEQRNDKTPRLSDLRESGEIEQTADIVTFIHREDYYDQNTENSNMASLIIAKHRNGPTGKIDLIFKKEITRFLSKEKYEKHE